MTQAVQVVLLFAALWTAVALYRGPEPCRFALALALGAMATHLGWALLHWPEAREHPAALLDPTLGYSVLFFPIGPLLLAPGAATWRALPLALAVARVGCLVAGCCGGVRGSFGNHPTPVYEIALLLLLHVALRSTPEPRSTGVFLLGFGLVRWIVEPFRAPPPLGEPALSAAAIAGAWMGLGLIALLPRALRRGAVATSLGLFVGSQPAPDPGSTPLAASHTPAPRSEVAEGAASPPQKAHAAPPKHAHGARGPVATRARRAVVAVLAARHAEQLPARARQALRDPSPAVRRVALEVNATVWDHEALPILIELENDPDPQVRRQARLLARRYLIWGPQRPTWRQRRDANQPGFEPHDRPGLRALRARR